MFWTKMKLLAVCLVAIGFVGGGAGLAAYRVQTGADEQVEVQAAVQEVPKSDNSNDEIKRLKDTINAHLVAIDALMNDKATLQAALEKADSQIDRLRKQIADLTGKMPADPRIEEIRRLVEQHRQKAGPAKPGEAPAPVQRETLRYGGKTFVEWQKELQTELKAEPRAEAMDAMAAFGTNGYGKEAAETVIGLMKGYNVVEAWGDEHDQKVLNAANRALQKIGKPAEPVLVEALKSRDVNSRRFVADFLIRSDYGPGVVPALLKATKDEDVPVRRSAVSAVPRQIRTEGVLEAVIDALKDADQDVRYFACLNLANLEVSGKPVALALAAAMKDKHGGIRQTAVTALGKLRGEAKLRVTALADGLKDEDRDVRQLAIKALATMGPEAKEAVPALVAAFDKLDHGDRLLVVGALGNIGPDAKEALPLLLGAINDATDRVLRSAAARAYEKIEGKRPGKPTP